MKAGFGLGHIGDGSSQGDNQAELTVDARSIRVGNRPGGG
jgi:hypothetical protein